MGEVIALSFGHKTTDGGKARILAHRETIKIAGSSPLQDCLPRLRNLAEPIHDWRDEDLTMDHADPGRFGGPIFLTPLMYERAKAAGYDMRQYVKQEPIPVDSGMPSDSSYSGEN